jgi:SecD/SecF fusion protein
MHRMAAIFNTLELKDRVKFNSTNAEVFDVIRRKPMLPSTIHLTSCVPVSTVLEWHSPISSSYRPVAGFLLNLPGIDNPERVRKLLQGTAQLEFWETYENQEVYPYLMQANQRLREITGDGTTFC